MGAVLRGTLMRSWAMLSVALLLAAALAGCGGKSGDGGGTTAPTSATTTTTTTPPTTPTNTTAPPGPNTVFNNSRQYKSPENDPDFGFTVSSGAKRLEVQVWINTTASGAYTVSAPAGEEKPYVAAVRPGGGVLKIFFSSYAGTSGQAGRNLETPPLAMFALSSADAGSWKFGVRGTGNNVQADIVAVEHFT